MTSKPFLGSTTRRFAAISARHRQVTPFVNLAFSVSCVNRGCGIQTPALLVKIPEKQGDSETGGTQSGTVGDQVSPSVDSGLAEVMNAWARLPEALRTGILAMIRAARG
jgi:hypothetical protein